MSGTATSPGLTGVLETGIYVDDMARARAFYESVFGLSPMFSDDRLTAYPVGPASVFLIFLRGGTVEPVTLPSGIVPAHDASGAQHFAFAISADAVAPWRNRLREAGVEIESEIVWPRGGTSLYFRDPDDHLVELVSPGLWENY
jgi:catechol 2,3-dioxygenase-like lactoylglutathione lyase family enzyme